MGRDRVVFKEGTGSSSTSAVALTAAEGITLEDLQRARGVDITVFSQAHRVVYSKGSVGTEAGAYVAANETISIEGRENVLNTKLRTESGAGSFNVRPWY